MSGRVAALHAMPEELARCRICRDHPRGAPLPHGPRPIFQISSTVRVAICSQAPGNKAHQAGKPFFDPSGRRLRDWMGLGEPEFYDRSKVAIIPMGFCFPGYDKSGGELPPRRECASTWHDALFAVLPQLRLKLCIGKYSLAYHLPHRKKQSLTGIVRDWREILAETEPHGVIALPHPSWRNNAWLAKNPWFEAEVLPALRKRVASALSS